MKHHIFARSKNVSYIWMWMWKWVYLSFVQEAAVYRWRCFSTTDWLDTLWLDSTHKCTNMKTVACDCWAPLVANHLYSFCKQLWWAHDRRQVFRTCALTSLKINLNLHSQSVTELMWWLRSITIFFLFMFLLVRANNNWTRLSRYCERQTF